MARAGNYFAWQRRLVAPELGRRVVEVGCGLGNFTRHLLDRELVVAVDVDPACVERLNSRIAQPNVQAFVCGPASEMFSGLVRFQPDSCVCLNVLEHIDGDRQALEAMASILVAGGVIVLLVPAFQALYGPIDRRLGHCRRYSRDSLARLARDSGLEIRKLHYINLIGFFGWWVNARLLRLEEQSQRQIDIFDRYLAPWISRVEALAAPPFGQSLFAVLRKP